jgi:hypothetical protein
MPDGKGELFGQGVRASKILGPYFAVATETIRWNLQWSAELSKLLYYILALYYICSLWELEYLKDPEYEFRMINLLWWTTLVLTYFYSYRNYCYDKEYTSVDDEGVE